MKLDLDYNYNNEGHQNDSEATIAILNSQNAIAYEEITVRLRNFPLHVPNS